VADKQHIAMRGLGKARIYASGKVDPSIILVQGIIVESLINELKKR
jgi:hypothetical protein